MEKDIKSETRGDFEKLLIALLQGQRDELEKPNKAAAKASAEELYKAGAKACFHCYFELNRSRQQILYLECRMYLENH